MLKPMSHRAVCLGTVVFGMMTALLYSAPQEQRTFDTPQQGFQVMIDASERNDIAALRQIFGPGSKDVVESGDPAEDKNDRAEFVKWAHEKTKMNQDPTNPNRATFTIGDEDWPFPVPLVRSGSKWRFDTANGKMEMLAHRIGENELDAIAACHDFVDAEMEYANTPQDGGGIREYARKVPSSPGKHDGLSSDGAAEKLLPKQLADAVASEKPFHGYYFRILTAQGPAAPGGAVNYMVNGRMIGGFAIVAWPTQYGVSGIKTFIVNYDGVVFEKDLGVKTALTVSQIRRFNPDKSWREVHVE